MKHTTAQKNQNKRALYIKIASWVVCIVVLGAAAMWYVLYRGAVDDPTAIRESLVGALTTGSKPAALEPKTGDVYFPEAKLFLARNQDILPEYRYTYESYAQNGQTSEMHSVAITTNAVMSTAISRLYSAQDSLTLFKRVPHAQSCARGVLLTDQALVQLDGRVLHTRQSVGNDRELYVYTDPGCPEADELLADIARIRAY